MPSLTERIVFVATIVLISSVVIILQYLLKEIQSTGRVRKVGRITPFPRVQIVGK